MSHFAELAVHLAGKLWRTNAGSRHPLQYPPGLTVDGYMAVRVVEGSIDGAECYDFVVNDVVSHVLLLELSVLLIDLEIPNINRCDCHGGEGTTLVR